MLHRISQFLVALTVILSGVVSDDIHAQESKSPDLKALISKYKADSRGPYKDIRWFCKDGTTQPAKEPCTKPGGVQRARYKDEVVSIGDKQHLYLGQILATTDPAAFWDSKSNHARLKQYQMEKYLRLIDDGWILRKAQFYRGAIQAEDEEAWGVEFYKYLLSQEGVLERQFFLIRQSIVDIPHKGDDNTAQRVRAVSKALSDSYPSFMDLRVKIHGKPEASDIQRVRKFGDDHGAKLNSSQKKELEELVKYMEQMFRPVEQSALMEKIRRLDEQSGIAQNLNIYVECYARAPISLEKSLATSQVLLEIRKALLTPIKAERKLELLDLSLNLESILFAEIADWEPASPQDLLRKIYILGMAAAGCGWIELWEWDELHPVLVKADLGQMTLADLSLLNERSRNLVEWGTSMIRAVYGETLKQFGAFEPLAAGFADDRIRGSILLPLGNLVSLLGDYYAEKAEFANKVMDLPGQGDMRGLNPGYALGELVVIEEAREEMEVDGSKIYVFDRPPADLKPVAGIATVSEGNMVSHVQLLARNLGIPNAVLSGGNLENLKKYSGQRVFYAVSPRGTVIMKPERELNEEEKALFETRKRSENKVSVPTTELILKDTLVNMADLRADDSGVLCGPKAANLGQLKALFPELVVEGFVIPFGVFRAHLDQQMPGEATSYWDCLQGIFGDVKFMHKQNKSEAEIDAYVLHELEYFRKAIKGISLKPDLVTGLEEHFKTIFGKPIGQVAVFLRSDTNMEDLKEFTGAGLNLTLFNVMEKEKILQGIRDVWASPYAERSYKWRQHYLLNPEHVYPSILIIPGVNVEKSGVMITKGISSDDPNDNSIAFNRGVGGAVEGQIAESYLLSNDGTDKLLSPAREYQYTVLKAIGGTEKKYTDFHTPILSEEERNALRDFSEQARGRLPGQPGIETDGPFDIELGFLDGKIWLFQVRPFVENKQAGKSDYLNSITPELQAQKIVDLRKAF